MVTKALHLYGQDDQPRKKSLMAPIVEGLISGGIVCGVLIALVAVLQYGTEGHSFVHKVYQGGIDDGKTAGKPVTEAFVNVGTLNSRIATLENQVKSLEEKLAKLKGQQR